MDAKSKADFINSVASGSIVPCPKCGTNNNSGSKFCISCGESLSAPAEAQNDVPAFAPAEAQNNAPAFAPTEPQNNVPAFAPAKESENGTAPDVPKASEAANKPEIPVKYEEPNNVFAQGLPEWSIEPPQVMVRRH